MLFKFKLNANSFGQAVYLCMYFKITDAQLAKAERTQVVHKTTDVSILTHVNSFGPTQLLLHTKSEDEAAQKIQHSQY